MEITGNVVGKCLSLWDALYSSSNNETVPFCEDISRKENAQNYIEIVSKM